ncbi:TPA: hypothetical protein ACPTZN_004747, partial [Klebsiella pneumoniae]
MSNLPEQISWESGIHQLEEADRAKAGPGGVLNIQANQLANRTRWLRALVESVQDYREYTFYKSESDPDGTIAGLANTPAGKMFRVAQGLSDELAFIYYLNDSGTATPITVLLGRGAIINNVREYSALMLAENDVAAGNILEGSKCWVTDLTDETLAVEYVNNGGTLQPTGRKMPSQKAVDEATAGVSALNLLITDSYLPQGYSAAITDHEGNAAALINDGGGFEIPELIVGGSSSAGEDMPGYVEAHTDEDGNLALGIRGDGVVEAPDLLAGSINISKDDLPDWSMAFTDEKNNVALGIRTGGEVEAPELLTAEVNLKKTEAPGWAVAWTDKNGNIALGI